MENVKKIAREWWFDILYIAVILYGFLLRISSNGANAYVKSLYVFNYFEYGLTKRSIIGTFFKILSWVFPNIYSPLGVNIVSHIITFATVIALYITLKHIIKNVENKEIAKCISIIASIFIIPTLYFVLFGYPDTLQILLVLIQLALLLKGKFEYLILPIAILEVLIHEAYACTLGPIILILVYYKFSKTKDKKYLFLGISHTILLLVLSVFILKLIPYDANPELFYKAIEQGKLLGNSSYLGLYSQVLKTPPVVDGVEVDPTFYDFLETVRKQLPIAIILFTPYWVPLIILGNKKTNLILLLIILLVLPNFILFCDYGRYFLYLVFNISLMILSMNYFKDNNFNKLVSRFNVKTLSLLSIYTVILTPLCIDINSITTTILAMIQTLWN